MRRPRRTMRLTTRRPPPPRPRLAATPNLRLRQPRRRRQPTRVPPRQIRHQPSCSFKARMSKPHCQRKSVRPVCGGDERSRSRKGAGTHHRFGDSGSGHIERASYGSGENRSRGGAEFRFLGSRGRDVVTGRNGRGIIRLDIDGGPDCGTGGRIAARAQSGANQFDIRLDPRELGRIDVRLETSTAAAR
jgi:hypothetical protein